MMQTMQMIAKFQGWEVKLTLSSCIEIFHNGKRIGNYDNAYDAIKAEVSDIETRRELLRQWAASR